MKYGISIILLCFSFSVWAEPGIEEIAEQLQEYQRQQASLQSQAESYYADRENDPSGVIEKLEDIKQQKQEILQSISKLESEKNRIARGVGCIEGRCIEGHGKYVSENGASYSGDFVSEKRQGQGVYTRSNGESFTGEWQENHLLGTCTRLRPGEQTPKSGNCSFENGKIVFVEDAVSDGSTESMEQIMQARESRDMSESTKVGMIVIVVILLFFAGAALYKKWQDEMYANTSQPPSSSSSIQSPSVSPRTPPISVVPQRSQVSDDEAFLQMAMGMAFSDTLMGSASSRPGRATPRPGGANSHRTTQTVTPTSLSGYHLEQERRRLRGVGRVREGNMDGRINFDD